ncbi:Neurexin 1, isoform A [Linnemannia schmuckeri]|uniref:protein-disulfide reductase n=1 Tax=Linnemannia schmuckeri TaxID=64567 RepID=A0A9P5V7C2_9FUNG|nr:Neurexin 1, isoform A [Linnemannia schmuckeri]
MATTVDSPTDNNNLATDAAPVAERATRAKATIDKHESILFKIKLQDATGKHVPVYEVASKTIGFLCAAGRYSACQELATLIDRFLEANPDFVIIYISLDQSVEAFNRTLAAHPRWLAIPFNAPVRTDILNEWQTKGVPCLHVYDPVEHEIVTSWGGSCLRFNAERCMSEWKNGREGVSYLQIVLGWWYYRAPPGVYRDMTDQELANSGFPSQESDGTKKNK